MLSKLIGPRRYTDPAYLRQIGAEIYGGAYRRDPALLEEHSRHIQPPRGRGYLYQLLAASGWTSLPWLGGLAADDARHAWQRRSDRAADEREDSRGEDSQCDAARDR